LAEAFKPYVGVFPRCVFAQFAQSLLVNHTFWLVVVLIEEAPRAVQPYAAYKRYAVKEHVFLDIDLWAAVWACSAPFTLRFHRLNIWRHFKKYCSCRRAGIGRNGMGLCRSNRSSLTVDITVSINDLRFHY
jgi:hypothetical protein